jgi:hypothetical protein
MHLANLTILPKAVGFRAGAQMTLLRPGVTTAKENLGRRLIPPYLSKERDDFIHNLASPRLGELRDAVIPPSTLAKPVECAYAAAFA